MFGGFDGDFYNDINILELEPIDVLISKQDIDDTFEKNILNSLDNQLCSDI